MKTSNWNEDLAISRPLQQDISKEMILDVKNVCVEFKTPSGPLEVVTDLNFSLGNGEILAIVGESGSGKSVSALSIMGLLPRSAHVSSGSVFYKNQDLLSIPREDMLSIRGKEISMVFQDPMSALNPVLSIGYQIMEPMKNHLGLDAALAETRAIELLEMVGISDPRSRINQYPHEFSGGMRQRVMIAIALACNPKILIADEPTTALDVTIQAQILELMRDLTRKMGISMILITHNLGVVARYADKLLVMYAGRVAELGNSDEIFNSPRHMYTKGLISCIPSLKKNQTNKLKEIKGNPPNLRGVGLGCRFASRCDEVDNEVCLQPIKGITTDVGTISFCNKWNSLIDLKSEFSKDEEIINSEISKRKILKVEGLNKSYELRNGYFRDKIKIQALKNITFDIYQGEILGVVGESGCGKSTLAKTILKLEDFDSGSIDFKGVDIGSIGSKASRSLRKDLQVVFQDPISSLNPRKKIRSLLEEPLKIHGIAKKKEDIEKIVKELIKKVGLSEELLDRYSHQLSGGQCQRVAIARAISVNPKFVICDEAISALDVSVQAQIVNLLKKIQTEYGISYLFIAHDLSVVKHISDRVMVMYMGSIVEMGNKEQIYSNPKHPYTKLLLEAVPEADPNIEKRRNIQLIKGEMPSPMNPPSGCRFRTRCPHAISECANEIPVMLDVGSQHQVACLRTKEISI